MIDPIVAAFAAAIVGASGSTAAAPSLPPPSCEQAAYTGATGAGHPADEVVEKIRAVVTEITGRARSGAAIDVPAVAEALDRANLPTPPVAGCTPGADDTIWTDRRDPRSTPGPAADHAAADAAAALAIRIIVALADAGFVTTPAPAATRSDPALPGRPPASDRSAPYSPGHSAPAAPADNDAVGSGSGDGDDGPQAPSGRGRAGDGAADAETAPLPRPAPRPRGGTDADPARPPTSRPPATTPESSTPGSAADAVEQLLGELAAALSTTDDPRLQQLVDDLRAVLDRGVTAPGSTGQPGQLPTAITDLLPDSATALFHDDFESGHLGKWGTCQGAGINGDCTSATVADGIGVTEDPERGQVAKFAVVDGKEAEMGGERSEVRDDNNPGTLVKVGDDRWYVWSMKFPADFPEPDGGWNILMQWHQSADSGSPPLALDISQGSLDIGGDGADAPRQTIGPIRRGEWVDYVLHVGFSQSDGFVEAWENGVQTVQRTARQTMADEASYLKMGIYRDPEATGDAAVLFDDFTILGGDGAPGLPAGDDTAGATGDSNKDADNKDAGSGDGGGDGGDASTPPPGEDRPDSPSSGPRRPSPPEDQSARPPAPTRAASPGRTSPPPPAGSPAGVEI